MVKPSLAFSLSIPQRRGAARARVNDRGLEALLGGAVQRSLKRSVGVARPALIATLCK